MSEKSKEQKFLSLTIKYPKVVKDSEEKKALFDKMFLLLEKNKETFPTKPILKKKREEIILDSDDFMFSINFEKKLFLRIMANDPIKNTLIVNAIGNSIISILNTLLEEQANGSQISSTLMSSLDERTNFPSKLVGTMQIARINEIAKETLTPTAIGIEFKIGNTDYVFSVYYSKRMTQDVFTATSLFEDKLPFDLLLKEQEKLNVAINVIDKLKKAEL